jgi:hypothetical protein
VQTAGSLFFKQSLNKEPGLSVIGMARAAIAVALLVVVGLAALLLYASFRIGPPFCCVPSQSSSQSAQNSTQTPEYTASPRKSSQQFLLLSYNFQVNGSTGSLFVVIKNYGPSNTSVTSVLFDGTAFNKSALSLDNGCVPFAIGSECGITLLFGPASYPPPAGGTLTVVIASGEQLAYDVVAGEMYHSGCTYTSSC